MTNPTDEKKAIEEMEEIEKALFFVDIPGLRLVKFAESYSIHEAKNPIKTDNENEEEAKLELGSKFVARLMEWPKKDEVQELFFKNVSFKGYGKLSDDEALEKLVNDKGLLILSQLFVLCFNHYVGERLSGRDTKADDRKE